MTSILCFGGAHMDHTLTLKGDPLHYVSNSVDGRWAPGGVAFNIAINLSNLGIRSGICSAVGDDSFATVVAEKAATLNINSDLLKTLPGKQTATYTAVIDESGDLWVGFCEDGIYDNMTPDYFEQKLPELLKWPIWVITTNMLVESITYLTKKAIEHGIQVFATPIAPRLTKKLLGGENRWTGLFLNSKEASMLSQKKIGSPAEAVAAAVYMHQEGCKYVFISMAEAGVAYCTAEEHGIAPAFPTTVIDVNGAGDAFMSGVLSQLGRVPLQQAITYGLMAAKLTIEVSGSAQAALTDEKIKENLRYVGYDGAC
jgi:pseudouridine kinase